MPSFLWAQTDCLGWYPSIRGEVDFVCNVCNPRVKSSEVEDLAGVVPGVALFLPISW